MRKLKILLPLFIFFLNIQYLCAQQSEESRAPLHKKNLESRSNNQGPSTNSVKRFVPREKKSVQGAMYLLNTGSDYQRNQEQQNNMKKTESYLFGVRYDRYGLYYETTQFEESTGAGNIYVERKNVSHMLWGDYNVLHTHYLRGFAGIGAGATLESVVTKFGSEASKDQSEYQWKGGAQIGGELLFQFMSLRLEGQLLTGNNRRPNPGYAVYARLGFILF